MVEQIIALVALTLMEIVLGIDNIVFISILTGKLPLDKQGLGRRLGLALALITRLLLLFLIFKIANLTYPIFTLSDVLPTRPLQAFFYERENGLGHSGTMNAASAEKAAEHQKQFDAEAWEEFNDVSWRDLILVAGGLFLIYNSVREIHSAVEGDPEEQHALPKRVSFAGVLIKVAVMDVVFSLDSVITAVGMAEQLWVMATAVIIAVGVMILFANQVGNYVDRNPTIRMLALAFLMLIGVMLVAEGIGTPIGKGYIYFAMAFSLLVEFFNMRVRSRDAGPRMHVA